MQLFEIQLITFKNNFINEKLHVFRINKNQFPGLDIETNPMQLNSQSSWLDLYSISPWMKLKASMFWTVFRAS